MKKFLLSTAVFFGFGAAGVLAAGLTFWPISEDWAAYAAARCMGWSPVGIHFGAKSDVPLLDSGISYTSSRVVAVSGIGACAMKPRRELTVFPSFGPETSVSVLRGPNQVNYVIMKISEGPGNTRTYRGMIEYSPKLRHRHRYERWERPSS